jgi:hypothetical protein
MAINRERADEVTAARMDRRSLGRLSASSEAQALRMTLPARWPSTTGVPQVPERKTARAPSLQLEPPA